MFAIGYFVNFQPTPENGIAESASLHMPERNGATEANSVRNKMKTLNRLKRSKPPLPVSIAKTVAPSNPPQPPTSEAVSLARRDRVIKRGTQRIKQQRLERETKSKVSTKTATPRTLPKLALPSPRPYTAKAPVLNSPSISSPVAPAFSEQTLKRFDMAVKGLKAQGRSLSERLTISAFHLRRDPVLAAIDPQELWRELSAQNK
jgi:hypothetical protein